MYDVVFFFLLLHHHYNNESHLLQAIRNYLKEDVLLAEKRALESAFCR